MGGIAAFFENTFYLATQAYVLQSDVTTWGWIHLIFGAIPHRHRHRHRHRGVLRCRMGTWVGIGLAARGPAPDRCLDRGARVSDPVDAEAARPAARQLRVKRVQAHPSVRRSAPLTTTQAATIGASTSAASSPFRSCSADILTLLVGVHIVVADDSSPRWRDGGTTHL